MHTTTEYIPNELPQLTIVISIKDGVFEVVSSLDCKIKTSEVLDFIAQNLNEQQEAETLYIEFSERSKNDYSLRQRLNERMAARWWRKLSELLEFVTFNSTRITPKT